MTDTSTGQLKTADSAVPPGSAPLDQALPPTADVPWWRLLNRYHWFVFIVAALGWLFDCLDQQIFNLTRNPAMIDLLNAKPGDAIVKSHGGWVTSIFLVGWASGGLIFGVLGDRIGRAKTMMLTILLYSLFTGLSAFSVGFWDFAAYRFLTGLGVGGEFAVGVALVAEVMPDRARAYALSSLQALSAVGNITAALLTMLFGHLEALGSLGAWGSWRPLFVVGALPALLALVIRRRLKEPERWQAAAQGEVKRKLGSYGELFRDPRWRKHAIVGLLLASVGIIGLWGIGFFVAELTRAVLRADFQSRGLSGPVLEGKLTFWAGMSFLVLNVGAFFGMYVFGVLTQRFGRRPTFAAAFVLAGLSTAMVFWFMNSLTDLFWMVPLMGFFQLSLFAGYAVYFPELFPTYLRSTGTSFCYNVGRFVAATGPFLLTKLASGVFSGPQYPEPLPWRYSGVTMCLVFVLGLVVLPFAPETKGQPLPEDERGFAH
jgi:MFS family permease